MFRRRFSLCLVMSPLVLAAVVALPGASQAADPLETPTDPAACAALGRPYSGLWSWGSASIRVPTPWGVNSSSSTAWGTRPSRITAASTPSATA